MNFVRLATGVVALSVVSTAALADATITHTATSAALDYARAKPMPLPRSSLAPSTLAKAVTSAQASTGPAVIVPGSAGSGEKKVVTLPASKYMASDDGISSDAYGYRSHPYTTARADLYGLRTTSAYPYRAAGKLFFKDGASTYVCSAALIKPGIVLTAAHCVANYGKKKFYTGHKFSPGYYVSGGKGYSPYGVWTAAKITIMTSYYNGTDSCAVTGVVCKSDIAVIAVNPQSGKYPGDKAGWFGYGLNGYSFVNNTAQITQLGYPVALDNGGLMERTDSYGFVSSANSSNTVIGSRQTGGSSGGPWVANFGIVPTITGAASTGYAAAANIAIGVTSWGYTDSGYQEQGASPFTSSNLGSLMSSICKAKKSAC